MTTKNMIVPVIMAGGQGTRLWPMSRAAHPKQFLPLLGTFSLFQETLRRVADPERYAAPVIITNADYRFLVAEQALEAGITPGAILLEPVARNTAPAIAAAAYHAARLHGPQTLLHVLASDHAVTVDDNYRWSLDAAAGAARAGRLVTFGITPTRPETGYGYIEAGAALGEGVHAVARFVEKPDRDRAEALLATGGHFWNSGTFMLKADVFLAEVTARAPGVAEAARLSVDRAVVDLDFIRLDAEAFAAAPNISVDYAIFEKSAAVALVPVTYPWSDLGSWDAVWMASPRDSAGNATRGPVTLANTSNALVVSERPHVAVDGLDDVVVIATDDAVYVGRLSEAQRVGAMVKTLRADEATKPLTEVHRTAYRPWGGYSSVEKGDRFQVKRLFVKPGKKLSVQRHHHRSEHWVVVRGTAEVLIDGEVKLLSENDSVYLPVGAIHRLSNPGKILLEVIEVQTGAYLGEDDIIRLADEFGRT